MVPLTRLVAGESMPADTVFERVPTPHLAKPIIVTNQYASRNFGFASRSAMPNRP
jgi:hypothetical protein